MGHGSWPSLSSGCRETMWEGSYKFFRHTLGWLFTTSFLCYFCSRHPPCDSRRPSACQRRWHIPKTSRQRRRETSTFHLTTSKLTRNPRKHHGVQLLKKTSKKRWRSQLGLSTNHFPAPRPKNHVASCGQFHRGTANTPSTITSTSNPISRF